VPRNRVPIRVPNCPLPGRLFMSPAYC
jgi:hypothetical protein